MFCRVEKLCPPARSPVRPTLKQGYYLLLIILIPSIDCTGDVHHGAACRPIPFAHHHVAHASVQHLYVSISIDRFPPSNSQLSS